MFTDANLPKQYWAEATSTATYLLNRNPVSALLGKTPEELWSGKAPKLKHLRVFDSKAWAYVPREKRGKWDPKAKELLFIGYDENTKGYLLIDPQTKRIIINRDVIFREEWQNEAQGKKGEHTLDYELADGTSEQAEEQLEEEHESSYTTGSDEADEENEPAQVQAGEQREEQIQQRPENTPRVRTEMETSDQNWIRIIFNKGAIRRNSRYVRGSDKQHRLPRMDEGNARRSYGPGKN